MSREFMELLDKIAEKYDALAPTWGATFGGYKSYGSPGIISIINVYFVPAEESWLRRDEIFLHLLHFEGEPGTPNHQLLASFNTMEYMQGDQSLDEYLIQHQRTRFIMEIDP